jgi:hypothetical protein
VHLDRFLTATLATTMVAAAFCVAAPAGAATTTDSPASSVEVKIVRDGITLDHVRTSVETTPKSAKGPTRSDFDGDGRDDIAGFSDGGVVVSYSSAPVRDNLVTEMVGGSGCACFGQEMVTGNFNGDKYDDLAIGDSSESDRKVADRKGWDSGAVWIFLGGPGGLQVDTVEHVNQSTAGVPGTSSSTDGFAEALAAGDITGDGKDELLVGMPFKKVAGKKAAGAVIVLKGSSTGIVTAGAKLISQNTSGVPSAAEPGDRFGTSIAVGKINKGKYQDVVIGAPGEDAGNPSSRGTGMVTQFWGSATGPSLKKVTSVSGAATRVAAQPKKLILWYFGQTLAIADTSGDGYGEVIVGDEGAQTGNHINGGVVATLAGRSTGLSVKGMLVLSKGDKSIAGNTHDDDWFGSSIATGDITGDGIADVLVGVPGENIGKIADAGSVVLLRGSSKGLTAAHSQTINQSSAGVPSTPERDDRFGASVSVLALNGPGRMDAAIGSPGEMVAGDTGTFSSGTVTTMVGVGAGLGNGTSVSGRTLGVGGNEYGTLAHQ